MATTIQISDEVQKRLFLFINEKEKEMGRRVTYSEAIQMLLENQVQQMDKEAFIKHVEKFQGILNIDDARKARDEERRLEREREQRLDRH